MAWHRDSDWHLQHNDACVSFRPGGQFPGSIQKVYDTAMIQANVAVIFHST